MGVARCVVDGPWAWRQGKAGGEQVDAGTLSAQKMAASQTSPVEEAKEEHKSLVASPIKEKVGEGDEPSALDNTVATPEISVED